MITDDILRHNWETQLQNHEINKIVIGVSEMHRELPDN